VEDPTAPRQYTPQDPENDPDHQIRQMISRRRKVATPEPESPSAPATGSPASPDLNKAEEPAPAAPPDEFSSAIASALRFKPVKKKADPKPEPAATPDPEPSPDEAAAKATGERPKSIVKKKPAAPAAPDISQITAAATTAAVRALQSAPALRQEAPPAPSAEDNLTPEDRHDYEVAKTLAEINPRYKDAPRVILDHVKKAESYAARWEAANPGRNFNPSDDAHTEFFDSLEKPWADHEFRTAEMEMAAERVASKKTRQSDARIQALERDNARLELTPISNQTFFSAAQYMAKKLNVMDKLSNGEFEKFAEEDPITAEAMNATLAPIQPIIEAIVQIDDPKGRFAIDDSNPAHQAWKNLLSDKEAQFAGTETADGKMFATRSEYQRMSNAQRSKHWYLTADLLVTEVVNDAVSAATERIKTEKERQIKIARSIGYVPADGVSTTKQKSGATNSLAIEKPSEGATVVQKPASPSVGSGAKIDSTGVVHSTGRSAALSAMSGILFNPGKTVS
jgi:hypothetical protein